MRSSAGCRYSAVSSLYSAHTGTTEGNKEILFFWVITFSLQLNPSEVYPQRPSGQVVVTDVFPSPRYMPSLLSRIEFSIPTSQLCMLVELRRCFQTLTLSRFPLVKFSARKSPYEHEYALKSLLMGRIQTRIIDILIAGTGFVYYSIGDA